MLSSSYGSSHGENHRLSTVAAVFAMVTAGVSWAGVTPIGDEFPVALGMGVGIQGKPGIAFGSANFLVAWSDSDTNSTYAARVSPNGVVLDDPPLQISVGLDTDSRHVSVGWDGSKWLVVWIAERSTHPGVGEVYASRVTTDGTILDPVGVRVTTGASAKVRMPGVAFDGTNFLVVWRSTSDHIIAARVTPEAVNLDAPVGFTVSNTGTSYYPSVAFDGTDFMACWHDSRNGAYDVWAARISTGGVTLDPNGFRVSDDPTYQEHGTIVFDGVDYLVQWYERGPGADPVYGSSWAARVSSDAVVLDPDPFPLFESTRGQIPVQAACDGTECVVVASWPQDRERNFRAEDVYARRVDQSGAVLGERGIPVSTEFYHQFGPVIAYGSDRYLVAWCDRRDPASPSIWARLLEVESSPPDTDSAVRAHGSRSTPRVVLDPPSSETLDWTVETLPGSWAGNGLAFGLSDSYAFGDSVFHTTGGGWVNEYDRDSMFGAWASDPSFIWVAGWARCFAHWDGRSWWIPSCNGPGACFSVWGSGPEDIWSCCDHGELLRFAATPQTWETVPTPTDSSLWDLWGAATDDVWAVGSAGAIVHFDGFAWTSQPGIPTDQSLNSVWGTGPDSIFAVGDWGTILNFDGFQWTEQSSGTTEHLFAVWGFHRDFVFAVGDSGTILRYDGNVWTPEASGTSENLLDVWGSVSPGGERGTVWASGIGSQVLSRTVDLPIFRDGFESGGTSAWSGTVP